MHWRPPQLAAYISGILRRDQSGFAPENLTTLAPFSVSPAMSLS
jgi:hypothetical protein